MIGQDDFAPGDREAAALFPDLRIHRVGDLADPDFRIAYDLLWNEFGALGEMERHDVIAERLAWDPARPRGGAALAYELLVLRLGDKVAALRDHTAVVRLDARGRPVPGPVVVHLSHALVLPPFRGGGLAAWLRALPLATARRCAAAAGCAPGTPIDLVAEMEHPNSDRPRGMARLRSYERAGFAKVDPAAAEYAQPDFRPPEVLAGTKPEAIPLGLVLRRVGREAEPDMPSHEVAAVVEAIYAVYGVHVPASAIDPLRAAAARWTHRKPAFALLPPTS